MSNKKQNEVPLSELINCLLRIEKGWKGDSRENYSVRLGENLLENLDDEIVINDIKQEIILIDKMQTECKKHESLRGLSRILSEDT